MTEYFRTEETDYPVNQDKDAYRVWESTWLGSSKDYGSAYINRIWNDFLSCHRRWMADPGGSLRITYNPDEDPNMEYHYEEIDGWMREWYVYVPDKIQETPARKVPLVFALHGYACTGEIYIGNAGWYQLARERGFIVVHPTAVPGGLEPGIDPKNPDNLPMPAWNSMQNASQRPNDIRFFKEIFRRICEKYPIDLARVYATGHSQGSLMVQALSLAMPEIFAAVAPCSGVIFSAVYDEFVNNPEFISDMSVPVWMFAGQEEPWLIEAEPLPENATGKTIAFWHERNGLPGKAEDRFRNDWNRNNNRWLDLSYENDYGQPMLRYTQVEYMPHATMPEMSWRIWDEFFVHWSRTENGLVYN